MNTAIAAIEEGINGASSCNVIYRARKRMGVSHEEFVQQPGDLVTVTASAGGLTSGDSIAAATLPVLYLIGAAMKATGTLAAMVQVRLTASRLWRPAHR